VVSTGSFCLVQIPLGFCLVQMLFWENIIDQFLNRRFDAETVVVEVMSTKQLEVSFCNAESPVKGARR
jgi:hypothetical protein